MKKNILILLVAIPTTVVINIACNKSIEGRTDNLSTLSPSNIDPDAGAWKLVLLSRPDSFVVAPPAATNSPGYIGELNEIKGLQQNLTSDQVDNIKYWSAGAVLRWNETMRELVAKYNLPPYQNADGTYPIPSSANPFAYPLFPFSNPPYAARAYAYVSAAQYDALVACWYYKKLYNRAAPYKVDSLINVNAKYIGKTDLPSYPSEDAVLAGVTAELMKLFFPTEIAFVEQKAADEKSGSIASGKNTRSDWTAGEALGRQIASVFAARGRTDNAGKAVGTPAHMGANGTRLLMQRGEIAMDQPGISETSPDAAFLWESKTFLFDSLTCHYNPSRSAPSHFKIIERGNRRGLNYTSNPTREKDEIIDFWADGVATLHPPVIGMI